MKRGVVLGLNLAQVVARANILADCAPIYYLLHDHNGGKDPTAPDPADHWSAPVEHPEPGAVPFVNRTCDCIGGAAWCGGWDRYQPVRFAHLYDGWINTDSMIDDAIGPARCFSRMDRPTPGAYIVCKSGSLHHAIGHIGVVIGYKLAEWDPTDPACWAAIEVVNVAAYHDEHGRPARANQRSTGRGWFGTNALFTRSIMVP
jgi:hypothetical protein